MDKFKKLSHEGEKKESAWEETLRNGGEDEAMEKDWNIFPCTAGGGALAVAGSYTERSHRSFPPPVSLCPFPTPSLSVGKTSLRDSCLLRDEREWK